MTIKSNINASVLKKLEAMSGKKLTLGSLLLAIRQGEELTQVEFSKMLGISKQYLCDLEHRRRYASPKAASDYAKKLGYNHLQFVRLCLQDMVDRDGIALHVDLKAA